MWIEERVSVGSARVITWYVWHRTWHTEGIHSVLLYIITTTTTIITTAITSTTITTTSTTSSSTITTWWEELEPSRVQWSTQVHPDSAGTRFLCSFLLSKLPGRFEMVCF